MPYRCRPPTCSGGRGRTYTCSCYRTWRSRRRGRSRWQNSRLIRRTFSLNTWECNSRCQAGRCPSSRPRHHTICLYNWGCNSRCPVYRCPCNRRIPRTACPYRRECSSHRPACRCRYSRRRRHTACPYTWGCSSRYPPCRCRCIRPDRRRSCRRIGVYRPWRRCRACRCTSWPRNPGTRPHPGRTGYRRCHRRRFHRAGSTQCSWRGRNHPPPGR